jgi:hypothetical protein
VYSRHCRSGDIERSVNEDGHCRDGIKENIRTGTPGALVQGDSARISCVIRMHEMNLEVFLMLELAAYPYVVRQVRPVS